jgi:hypothetical protein
MSTISQMAARPPKISMQERLQSELDDEVSSGTIASSDESALTDAIAGIDAAMRSSAAATDPASGAAPASPEEMTAKIQSLIDDQVEAGTITSDQATTLTKLFESAAPQGGKGAPPQGGADASAALDDFLAALQSSQDTPSAYAASGATVAARAGALVLDTTA